MPADLGQKYKLAINAHRNGDFEEAIVLFESLLTEFSNDGKVVYNYANVLADANKGEKAIEMYLRALEIEKIPNIYFNLGNTYLDLKIYDLAINAFDNAIHMKNDYFAAMFNKAISLSKDGLQDAARKIYLDIVEKDERFHQAWFNAACIAAHDGMVEDSLSYLTQAIKFQKEIDYRELAKSDDDFGRIRHLKKFRDLVTK